MSYVPPRELLKGRPAAVAECYGKPNVGAYYRGLSMQATRIEEQAACCVCGKPATNAHHWPYRSGGGFTFHGKMLRPSLFALCGNGNLYGCHGKWHGNGVKALWMWDMEEYAREWWEGSMFEELGAHSPKLYQFGRWEMYDIGNGRVWEVRQ